MAARMRRAAFALLTLSIVGAAAFLREPSLFLEPRFWAEEGTHYFGSALHHGVVDALLNVRAAPHNSYFHPIPTIATVAAAHLLPLERAPWGTTVAWILVVLSVEMVVLFGRAALLDPPGVRFLVALSPLLSVGFAESWVNSLGAHFYCDLALVLLFLESPRVSGARRRLGLAAFGVFAFLSPTAFVVAPAVVGMCVLRWRRQWPYALVLLVFIALQAWVHIAFFEPAGRTLEDPAALPHLFVSKFFLWPFLGQGAKYAYGNWARDLEPGAFVLTSLGATAAAVLLIGGFVLAARRTETTAVLLVAWLTAAASYLFLGLSVGRDQLVAAYNGGRYAFLPTMLLFALIAHQIAVQSERHRLRRLVFAGLLGAMFLVGTLEFFPARFAAAKLRGFAWTEEVAQHRADPSYNQLRIAPPGWVVEVPAEIR